MTTLSIDFVRLILAAALQCSCSTQSLAACRDILCVDKTGTLTDDEVVLVKSLDAEFQPSLECLKLGYANSLFQVAFACQGRFFVPDMCFCLLIMVPNSMLECKCVTARRTNDDK